MAYRVRDNMSIDDATIGVSKTGIEKYKTELQFTVINDTINPPFFQGVNHNYFIFFVMPKYYYTDVSTSIREQIDVLYQYPLKLTMNIKTTWFDI